MLRILLPLLFLILLTACSPVHAEPAFPSCVDTNGDGVIDRDEVHTGHCGLLCGAVRTDFYSDPD